MSADKAQKCSPAQRGRGRTSVHRLRPFLHRRSLTHQLRPFQLVNLKPKKIGRSGEAPGGIRQLTARAGERPGRGACSQWPWVHQDCFIAIQSTQALIKQSSRLTVRGKLSARCRTRSVRDLTDTTRCQSEEKTGSRASPTFSQDLTVTSPLKIGKVPSHPMIRSPAQLGRGRSRTLRLRLFQLVQTKPKKILITYLPQLSVRWALSVKP